VPRFVEPMTIFSNNSNQSNKFPTLHLSYHFQSHYNSMMPLDAERWRAQIAAACMSRIRPRMHILLPGELPRRSFCVRVRQQKPVFGFELAQKKEVRALCSLILFVCST
jgi:hypothetical protein